MSSRTRILNSKGKPLANLNKTTSKRIEMLAKTYAAEEGVPLQEAREEVVNNLVRDDIARREMEGIGLSSMGLGGLGKLSMDQGLAVLGMDDKQRTNRTWVDDEIDRLSAEHGRDMRWVSEGREHLLEPKNRDELQRQIAHEMTKGKSRSEALEEALLENDKILSLQDLEKLMKNAERMHKDGDPDAPNAEGMEGLRRTVAEARREHRVLNKMVPWFKRLKKLHQLNASAKTLMVYLGTVSITEQLAEALGDPLSEGEKQQRSLIRDQICRCRVFDTAPSVVEGMLWRTIEHLNAVLPDDEEVHTASIQTLSELIVDEPLSDPPYPYFFIGFGDGIDILGELQNPDRPDVLKGILYSPGYVEAVFQGNMNKEPRIQMCWARTLMDKNEWTLEDNIDGPLAWLAITLPQVISAHRTIILEAPTDRRTDKVVRRLRQQIDLHTMPPAFYTVELRSRVHLNALRRLSPVAAQRAKMNYRTDRRAHERCFVRRGPLPKTTEEQGEFLLLQRKLKDRGYAVYTTEEVGLADMDRIYVRGMRPKRDDEWLAVLTTQVQDCVFGPPDAPYVPRVDVITGDYPDGPQERS